MNLTSERDVEATQQKIRLLEARYEELRRQAADDAHVRALTLRSLKRVVNQMQEDIVRYRSRAATTQR
jgi:hypothetical protein